MKNVNCASSHLRTFSRRFIIRASLVFLYSVIPTPIPERQQKTSEHCVHFTNKCVENIYNDLLQHNRSSNNSTTVRCTGDLKNQTFPTIVIQGVTEKNIKCIVTLQSRVSRTFTQKCLETKAKLTQRKEAVSILSIINILCSAVDEWATQKNDIGKNVHTTQQKIFNPLTKIFWKSIKILPWAEPCVGYYNTLCSGENGP